MDGDFALDTLRPGVGIVLVNKDRLVWMGERIDTIGAWQMPQGGIDVGEDPKETALRELEEETGISAQHITYISETSQWYSLIWPAEIQKQFTLNNNHTFEGQYQKWFLFLLDSNIDPTNLHSHHPEFRAHKWLPHHTLVDVVIDFKKDLYRQVLNEFQWYFND